MTLRQPVAAFEACEWAIRELKRTVPIWKNEIFEDSEVWVKGEASNVKSSSQPAWGLPPLIGLHRPCIN